MLSSYKIYLVVYSTVSIMMLTSSIAVDSLVQKGGNGIGVAFMKKQELQKNVGGRWVPHEPDVLLRNLAKYDIMWGAQRIQKEAGIQNWRLLRRRWPEKLTLYYTCGATARLGHDRKKSGHLDYDYMNIYHPEWFLLSDCLSSVRSDPRILDNRIRWVAARKGGELYNRFYLDVGNKDFQKWAAQQFLECASGKVDNLKIPFDGLGMDNAYVGIQNYSNITSQDPHWKYGGRFEAWNRDFCDYLKVVKKLLNEHGFILVVNHDLDRKFGVSQRHWDRLYESVDGLMTEQSLRHGWGDTAYFAGSQWLAAMTRHEEILDKDLIYWWVSWPPAKDESFMYTYCSWLLIRKPGKSFFAARRGDYYHTYWYAAYDLPIGSPASNRYLQNKCWLRDYENAKVVVNPTERIQKVTTDRDKLWLDWMSKKAVSELELPAQSGRILLPTPYKVK